jgi:hypothetical protein
LQLIHLLLKLMKLSLQGDDGRIQSRKMGLDGARRLVPLRLGKGNAPDQIVDWN